MEDKEYIEQLEQMIHFLSTAYTECKEEFHDKHLREASNREITDQEWEEMNRFPKIQGALGLWLMRFVKNTKYERKPIKVRYIFDRIAKKPLSDKLKQPCVAITLKTS